MSGENTIKLELEEIKSLNNYIFLKNVSIVDDEARYIIGQKIIEKQISDYSHDYQMFSFTTKLIYLDKEYFAYVFKSNIDISVVEAIFNYASTKQINIFESIEEIKKMLISFQGKKIDLMTLRGLFAEMHIINEFNFSPKLFNNSIFDLVDEKGNDVEVKSFSPTSQNIWVSYQQTINNKNANFYFVDLVESSEGIGILDEFNKMESSKKVRYLIVEFLEKNILDYKFKINNIYKKVSSDIFKEIYLPADALDAKFKFNAMVLLGIK